MRRCGKLLVGSRRADANVNRVAGAVGRHPAAASPQVSLFLCVMNVSAFAELEASSVHAQDGLDALAAELTAAVHRRHAELTRQLRQQKQVSRSRRSGSQFMATDSMPWEECRWPVAQMQLARFPFGDAEA